MKLEEALIFLGFEKLAVLPKLKEIQRSFYRLSKIIHPDKNNGSKESTSQFQTLLEAYHIAGKAAERVEPEKDDFDEIIARKLFQQFQFSSVKINSQSVTIKTEKSLNSTWLEVLKTNLGEPVTTKDIHGKKFTLLDKCEEPSTNVYLTLYHNGILLVQAQGNKQSINIHFIDSHLRDLFIQVYKRSKLLEKVPGNLSHKTPLRKLTKTSKNPSKKIKCPKCEYLTDITSHLAKHMKKVHGNSASRKLSISVTPWHCDLCGSEFVTEHDLKSHIKNVHELLCSLCSAIFYDKFDLEIHMKTHRIVNEKNPSEDVVYMVRCNFCASNFFSDSDLRLHVAAYHTNIDQNVHQGTPKSLVQEFVEIGEIPMLQNHPAVAQIALYECSQCNVTFADEEDLKTHMIRKHEEQDKQQEKLLKCEKCLFSTTEDVVLKHHVLMMHVPGFECHECEEIIWPEDPVADCSVCSFFYHKKCTNMPGNFPTSMSWTCHYCCRVPCQICPYQASNEKSLEVHMLSNHCPDIAYQCEICCKRFQYEDNLKIHILKCHSSGNEDVFQDPQKLSCELCSYTFDSQENLNNHLKEHETVTVHITCTECQTTVKTSDLKINCDKCESIFHKKCTTLKSATGHWKPRNWECNKCQNISDTHANDEVDAQETIEKENHEDENIISKPSAKHRKSNAIGCNHPDKDFLTSQINTLKSVIAKREAELKKVQESDNLKAKKIMQLEAQLREARKNGCMPDDDDKDCDDSSKIKNLEMKTATLEEQVAILFNKLKMGIHAETSIFNCETCNKEFNHKDKLNMHRKKEHTTDETDFTHVNEHQEPNYEKFYCMKCNFTTEANCDLEKHMQNQHHKCNLCSYHAIHQRDLRRHKSTMHSLVTPCELCPYKALNDQDLKRHKLTMHKDPDFSSNNCDYMSNRESNVRRHQENIHTNDNNFECKICGYTARDNKELEEHVCATHQRQRTRIFSSRTLSNTNTHVAQKAPFQDGIFQPWSPSNNHTRLVQKQKQNGN